MHVEKDKARILASYLLLMISSYRDPRIYAHPRKMQRTGNSIKNPTGRADNAGLGSHGIRVAFSLTIATQFLQTPVSGKNKMHWDMDRNVEILSWHFLAAQILGVAPHGILSMFVIVIFMFLHFHSR
jgi:hypothetical protein